MRRAPAVNPSPDEAAVLASWVAEGAHPRRSLRARIVLEAAGGRSNAEVARLLGVHPDTVARWRRRFVVTRLDGLARTAPRQRPLPEPRSDLVGRILSITLEEPPGGLRPWTTRSLARSLGVNHMVVHRVWRTHGVIPPSRPGRSERPPTRARIDPVGIYLYAPAAAVVFSVEERPVEPSTPEVTSGREPGVGRAGSDELVACLASIEENVAPHEPSDRAAPELLVHLRSVESRAPAGAQLNVLFDRPYELLPSPVRSWLDRHPRFRVYTPEPGQGWTRLVESWLRRYAAAPLDPESFRTVLPFTTWLRDAVHRAGSGRVVATWVQGTPGPGPG